MSVTKMSALFIVKRGIINICRSSPRHYNNNTPHSSRCFTAPGSNGGGESSASMNEVRQETPDVSLSYAADTAKEGLKQATDLAKEESGDAATEEAGTVAGGEEESEENMTVGEIGTVRGQNHS